MIIIDQFEEYFFANMEPKDKRLFAEFLQKCLGIPFVKIVLSLREDYIQYLLELYRLGNLDAINNDIIDEVSSFVITQVLIRDLPSKRAIRIEALLQNGAMGFVVGTLILTEIQYLVPITIYALLQYCFLLFYLGNMQLKK